MSQNSRFKKYTSSSRFSRYSSDDYSWIAGWDQLPQEYKDRIINSGSLQQLRSALQNGLNYTKNRFGVGSVNEAITYLDELEGEALKDIDTIVKEGQAHANSLPTTQVAQLRAAGINPDLSDIQPSTMSDSDDISNTPSATEQAARSSAAAANMASNMMSAVNSLMQAGLGIAQQLGAFKQLDNQSTALAFDSKLKAQTIEANNIEMASKLYPQFVHERKGKILDDGTFETSMELSIPEEFRSYNPAVAQYIEYMHHSSVGAKAATDAHADLISSRNSYVESAANSVISYDDSGTTQSPQSKKRVSALSAHANFMYDIIRIQDASSRQRLGADISEDRERQAMNDVQYTDPITGETMSYGEALGSSDIVSSYLDTINDESSLLIAARTYAYLMEINELAQDGDLFASGIMWTSDFVNMVKQTNLDGLISTIYDDLSGAINAFVTKNPKKAFGKLSKSFSKKK